MAIILGVSALFLRKLLISMEINSKVQIKLNYAKSEDMHLSTVEIKPFNFLKLEIILSFRRIFA